MRPDLWRIWRSIAREHAHQLRRHPVRLWPIVEQEQHAKRLLVDAHGHLPRVTPLDIDPRTRIGDVA